MLYSAARKCKAVFCVLPLHDALCANNCVFAFCTPVTYQKHRCHNIFGLLSRDHHPTKLLLCQKFTAGCFGELPSDLQHALVIWEQKTVLISKGATSAAFLTYDNRKYTLKLLHSRILIRYSHKPT